MDRVQYEGSLPKVRIAVAGMAFLLGMLGFITSFATTTPPLAFDIICCVAYVMCALLYALSYALPRRSEYAPLPMEPADEQL